MGCGASKTNANNVAAPAAAKPQEAPKVPAKTEEHAQPVEHQPAASSKQPTPRENEPTKQPSQLLAPQSSSLGASPRSSPRSATPRQPSPRAPETAPAPTVPAEPTHWLDTIPAEAKIQFNKAKDHMESQKYDDAFKCFDKSIELVGGTSECENKKYHELLYNRGLARFGKDKSGVEDLEAAIRCCSDPVPLKYCKLSARMQKKTYTYLSPYASCLVKWAEQEPDSVEYLMWKVYACYSYSYYSYQTEMESCLKKAMEIEPNSAKVHAWSGKVNMYASKDEEAITAYKKALSLNPSKPKWCWNLAQVLARSSKEEDKKEAIQFYNKAYELMTNNTDFQTDRATFFEKMELWQEAMDAWKVVIAQKPTTSENISRTHINPLLKITRSNEILEKEPNDVRALQQKIKAMTKLGNAFSSKVLELANRCVELDPHNQQSLVIRAETWLHLGAGSSDMCKADLEAASKMGDYWRYHYANHILKSDSGADAEAVLDELRKADTLKPNHHIILKRKCYREKSCGNIENALDDYLKFLQIGRAVEGEASDYVSLCMEKNLWRRAEDAIELALKFGVDCTNSMPRVRRCRELTDEVEKNPTAKAYIERGDAYISYGQTTSAIEDYLKACELDASNKEALLKLANTYKDNYNIDSAISYYTKLITLDPKNATAYSKRAMCYLNSALDNRKTLALQDAQKAVDLEPGVASFWENLRTAKKSAETINWKDVMDINEKLVKLQNELIHANPKEASLQDALVAYKLEWADSALENGDVSLAARLYKECSYETNTLRAEHILELSARIEQQEKEGVNFDEIAENWIALLNDWGYFSKDHVARAKAEEQIKKEAWSKNIKFMTKLADLYAVACSYQKVFDTYQTLISAHPQDGSLYLKRADLLWYSWIYEVETRNKILADYLKAEELGGCTMDWYRMKYLAENTENWDLLIKTLDKLSEQNGPSSDWLSAKAETYEKKGDLPSAVAAIEKACELSPNYSSLWAAKSQLLVKMGDLEGAIKAVTKAAEIDSGYVPQQILAWIYYKQGKLVEAEEHAKKATSDSTYAYKAFFVLAKAHESKHEWQQSLDQLGNAVSDKDIEEEICQLAHTCRTHLNPSLVLTDATPGDFVDVVDTVKKWYPATVVNVKEENGHKKVEIHYFGWDARYNEWFDLRSVRVSAPFMHTDTYGSLGSHLTGAEKCEHCEKLKEKCSSYKFGGIPFSGVTPFTDIVK